MEREDAMEALAALERAHEQLWQASQQEGEDGWKPRYLGLRRQLQGQTARLVQVDCVALGLSEDDGQAYRAALGRFRSTAALHQANWPVIDIAIHDPEYRRSIEAVRTSCVDFITVMRRLFGQRRSG